MPITATTNQSSITSTEADINNATAAVAAAERDREADLARLREAQANNANAQADLARYKTLVGKEEVSREEYDQKVAASEAQAAQVQSLQAVAESRRRSSIRSVPRSPQSRSSCNKCAVPRRRNWRSPRRGTVRASQCAGRQGAGRPGAAQFEVHQNTGAGQRRSGTQIAEIGQRVQPGQQLLVIVPLDDIWVTANFKESQIRRMHPGQTVRIHVDAFDKDYDGTWRACRPRPVPSSASCRRRTPPETLSK